MWHSDTDVTAHPVIIQATASSTCCCATKLWALHAPLPHTVRCAVPDWRSEQCVRLQRIRSETDCGLWKVGRGDEVIWGHMGTGTSWRQHNSMARLAVLPTSYALSALYPQLAAVNSVFISCILIISLCIRVNRTENFYRLYISTRICYSPHTCYSPCSSHPSCFLL